MNDRRGWKGSYQFVHDRLGDVFKLDKHVPTMAAPIWPSKNYSMAPDYAKEPCRPYYSQMQPICKGGKDWVLLIMAALILLIVLFFRFGKP